MTAQVEQWLARGEVKKLVCVICSVDGDEVLERWAFDVETDQEARALAKENDGENKSVKTFTSIFNSAYDASVAHNQVFGCLIV